MVVRTARTIQLLTSSDKRIICTQMDEKKYQNYLITILCASCGQPNSIIEPSIMNQELCAFCSFPLKSQKSKLIKGFVYILSNDLMPGLLKIGFTERGVEDRVNELSKSTGVPSYFNIEAYFPTDHPAESEAIIHKLLSGFRIENKEFFKISIDQAIRLISQEFEHTPVIFNKNILLPKKIRWLQCKTCDTVWEISYDTKPDPKCPKCGWHLSKRLNRPK
jgi:Zn finger protein HypA/HybF involved in hydrogenase expression